MPLPRNPPDEGLREQNDRVNRKERSEIGQAHQDKMLRNAPRLDTAVHLGCGPAIFARVVAEVVAPVIDLSTRDERAGYRRDR